MPSIWLVAGTRPEIIKLAPVYRLLRKRASHDVAWVSTGQHTHLAQQTAACFAIRPDIELKLVRSRTANGNGRTAPQSASAGVAGTLAELVSSLDRAMTAHGPDLVVVQGDTTSTLAATLAAFSQRVPVAHVEAGLRSFNLAHPFPEEAWRRLVSQIASLHFAPTRGAARNLLASGIPEDRIVVTGNTVVDALRWLIANGPRPTVWRTWKGRERIVLVTLHRRENWQAAFQAVCGAILALRDTFEDVRFCFVAHANPELHGQVVRRLAGEERVHVLEPLDYATFIDLMRASTLVLTDSGGVQEEAPALGVPVLVLRETTERPEAIEAGVAKLVGTNPTTVFKTARTMLADEKARRGMAKTVSPFGDGHAAERIAKSIDGLLKPKRSARISA